MQSFVVHFVVVVAVTIKDWKNSQNTGVVVKCIAQGQVGFSWKFSYNSSTGYYDNHGISVWNRPDLMLINSEICQVFLVDLL